MFKFLTLYSFEVFIAETMYNLSLPKLFSKIMFTFLTLYSFEVFIAETVYNLSLKNNVYFLADSIALYGNIFLASLKSQKNSEFPGF